MHKWYSITLYKVIGLTISTCFTYYLLVRDSFLPFTIEAVAHRVQPIVLHYPILEVVILPIYMALMVFGITIMGFYLGAVLERLFGHSKSKRHP